MYDPIVKIYVNFAMEKASKSIVHHYNVHRFFSHKSNFANIFSLKDSIICCVCCLISIFL